MNMEGKRKAESFAESSKPPKVVYVFGKVLSLMRIVERIFVDNVPFFTLLALEE